MKTEKLLIKKKVVFKAKKRPGINHFGVNSTEPCITMTISNSITTIII